MSPLTGTSQQGLLATIWLFTSLAIILFILRVVVRRSVQHKLYWDDGFAALAMALLLASSILYTVLIPYAYELIDLLSGTRPPLSMADSQALSLELQKLLIPLQAFFWTGLWAVKFSFLFLYRMLICHNKKTCVIWYLSATFMLLTWGLMLVAVFAQCGPRAQLLDLAACNAPANVAFNREYIWVEFTFVVITDFLVIILPLPTLWNLHLTQRQKLAVTPVFCLALICVAFDTLRTVEQYKGSLALGLLWTSLELEIAVVVCMLPSFRFLLAASDEGRLYRRRFLSIITFGSLRGGNGSSRDNIAMLDTPRAERASGGGVGTSGSNNDVACSAAGSSLSDSIHKDTRSEIRIEQTIMQEHSPAEA